MVNSNCGRSPDPATPSCARGSPQHTWLNYAQARRHGGADLVLSGHSHSTGRTGAMTPSGTLSPTGAGIRQLTAEAGGRSLTPHRVNPPRVGTRYRDSARYGLLRLA